MIKIKTGNTWRLVRLSAVISSSTDGVKQMTSAVLAILYSKNAAALGLKRE
jgi:hypothetical protein